MPGKPNGRLSQCVSVCGTSQSHKLFCLLTFHQAAYLAGLQFPGQAAPVSNRVSGALGNPEGQSEGWDPT